MALNVKTLERRPVEQGRQFRALPVYAAIGAFLTLGGCVSVLGPENAPEAYVRLTDGQAEPTFRLAGAELKAPNAARTIGLDEPDMPRTLAGRDILMADASGQLRVIAGLQWEDNLPMLLQGRLSQALRAQGLVPLDPLSASRSELSLVWRVSQFETFATAGGAVEARFAFEATVLTSRRAFVAQQVFAFSEPLRDDRATTRLEGLRLVASRGSEALAAWVAQVAPSG